MRITKVSHPNCFRAFLEIDYDNGMVNRLEPEARYYDIPDQKARELEVAERLLGLLSPEDLSTFCCGEQREREAIIEENQDFRIADDLLSAYFNKWETCEEAN